MRLKVNNKVSAMEIFAEGDEVTRILGGDPAVDGQSVKVAEIENPILMTDPYRIGQFDSVSRDVLFQLYQSFPRITEYDGAECSWDPKIYPGVWCPSNDTLFFALALREQLETKPSIGAAKIRSVIDIGCGSGFLGKYAMKKLASLGHPVKKLHFLDIDPTAVRCAMDNSEKERDTTFISYSLNRSADGLNLEGRYDLAICNPPYIPRPQSVSANPYEGLSLLREVIFRSDEIVTDNGLLMTNFSSLCEKEFKSWCEEKKLACETLLKIRVPLKVLPVTSGLTQKSRDWLDYLAKKGPGLEIDKEEKSGYRYWHTINIVLIERGKRKK